MAFTAQELNHRLAFQRKEEVQDENGDITTEWVEVASAFARVDPMLGREYLASKATQSEEVTKFTMRYLTDVTTADRLVHDGAAWNMQSIINVGGRNRETLIYATRLN